MKIAYFNPVGGVSGSMLIAALLDAGGNERQLLLDLARLDLSHWKWQRTTEKRRGFDGTKIHFLIEKTKSAPERRLDEIEEIIKKSNFAKPAEEMVLKAFSLLCDAETKTHQIEKEQIQFHEVDAIETILTISAAALLLDEMGIKKVYCTALPLGSGAVVCNHGEIPLPAPALNELLCGVPIYGNNEKRETITVTGMALLKAMDCNFGDFPAMTTEKTGAGIGAHDGALPDLMRVFIGESGKESRHGLYRLECTIDDMSGEEMGFLWDMVYAAGANDMYYTPVYMKKGRPAVKLTVLTEGKSLEKVRETLFTYTTTIGMICNEMQRFTLERDFKTVTTPYGDVGFKCAKGYGVKKAKAEYEDLKKIAEETGMPVAEVRKIAEQIFSREHDKI
jgi:uncharacterized protein (TIGR00299 family) protein